MRTVTQSTFKGLSDNVESKCPAPPPRDCRWVLSGVAYGPGLWSATIAKLSNFALAAVITIMSRSILTSVAYSVGPPPLSNYNVLLSKRPACVAVIVLHNVGLKVMGPNLIRVMRNFSALTVPSPAQSLESVSYTHLTLPTKIGV